MTDMCFNISSIDIESDLDITDDYQTDSDEESNYDNEELESLENMRDKLTDLENIIKDSCYKIQDFIFEISESDKITQNEYLNNSNNIKNIFDSYQKSILVLSHINNVISFNYEEKNIELNDVLSENKRLKTLVENLKFKSEILYQKNKRLNDKNISLNTILQ